MDVSMRHFHTYHTLSDTLAGDFETASATMASLLGQNEDHQEL